MASQHHFQRQAQQFFDQHGLPGKKVENWKYTNLAALFSRQQLKPVTRTAKALKDKAVDNAIKLIFIDGRLDETASDLAQLPQGVTIHSLASYQKSHAKAIEKYHREHPIDYDYHRMAAMNHAQACDGLWLEIADNVHVAQPIQLIYQASAATSSDASTLPVASYLNMMTLGQQSQVTIIEDAQTQHDTAYLINSVTSIKCQAQAKLDYFMIQRKCQQLSHIANLQLWQHQDTDVYAFNAADGGAIGRFDIHSHLIETGAKCVLDGVFRLSGKSHTDSHILVEHLASHTTSDVCYKGLAYDQSHGVWNAKAIVHQGVKQADVQQSNKNLLLSKKASIDTKPELEIYANDLKCSHGATVGQLNENELFYLQSRGIPQPVAKSMLTDAFCREVTARIANDALKDWIENFENRLVEYQ